MTPWSGPVPSEADSLFARARAGDDAAWEELFRECYPKVIRVVRRKMHRPSMRPLFDSTDFASDVMKSLAAKADRLDFPSIQALFAFLMDEAEKKVIDEYRKLHSQKRDVGRLRRLDPEQDGSALDERAGPIVSHEPTASQVVAAQETHERLVDGQDAVSREMIRLKREGHSVAEIAQRTGANIRWVQRFFKALGDKHLSRSA